MVSYHVLACAHDFYYGYKNHGRVLASPTQSFIMAIIQPQCAHAHALALLLHLAFDDLGYFMKVMARCSPLDEAATCMTEVENMDEVVVAAELEHAFRESPATSDGERRL
jgi:hypothetical protein